MTRAFLSLYGFIVLSVVLIGWSLNQFWDSIAPEQEPAAEVVALLHLLERDLSQQPTYQEQAARAAQLATDLKLSLELLALDDMAQSGAWAAIQAGEPLAIVQDDRVVWYKRLATSDAILLVSIPLADERESPVYRLLLLFFYLALALAIYLWVWPLSRDAQKLEQQTHLLGQDGVPQALQISPTSPLYPLAQAFNRMAQRLRDLIASHREMTNAVSHELRTPLARMKFALALMDDGQLQAKNRQQVQSMEQDVMEMEALISALLRYAGFEQQSQTLQQTPGHMSDLLASLEQRFYRHHPGRLRWDIRDHTGGAAFCCEWKLMETVLENLTHNAARYAHQTLLIELMQTPTQYLIAVEDDGPGIPVDKREQVFDSFVRLYDQARDEADKANADTQTSRRAGAAGGFGLGLAIVKRILQWHHGSARFVDPHELGGARVEICWAITTGEDPVPR